MTGPVILRIDAAIRGNRLIYWLGRIPLVKRLVSDTLYSAGEGKLALSILLWIWQALRALFGTFFYLTVMCGLPLLLAVEPDQLLTPAGFDRFCWLLLLLSFFLGSLLNPCAVAHSELKYTCVRMMSMDARRFHFWAELKHFARYFLTFTPALMVAAALFGVNALTGLLLTVELVCFRLVTEWLHILAYEKLGEPLFGRTWFTLVVAAVGLLGGYAVALATWTLPVRRWLVSLPAALLLLVLGALSVVMLCRYRGYYRLTVDVCKAERMAHVKDNDAQFNDVKLKDSDLKTSEETSSLTGWAYLQDLFFRRHSRMMYKPLKYMLIVLAALAVLGGVAVSVLDTANLFSSVTMVLPYCVFVLYILQNNIIGARITKAMFYNCDLAMLKFGWYRQSGVVLKNFGLRFRRMCGVNLLLSGAFCVLFTVLVLCAGGRPPVIDYLLFLVALLALGVFFAVHSLGMYYLFQPYTSDLQVKNPFFAVINGIMYVVCYSCIQIHSTPAWFTLVVLGVTVVYSAVILLAVWKRAPKTFRVK